MVVRRAQLEDMEAVEAFSQTDPATKEFKYLWRRYQNWDAESNSRPIIAVRDDGAIVGLHAAAFGFCSSCCGAGSGGGAGSLAKAA